MSVVITTSRIQLAKSSIATVNTHGGQNVISMRTANGVGDNQKLQEIADALSRGEVTIADIKA